MKHPLDALPRIEKHYQADVFYYEGPITEEGARRLRTSMELTELKYANVLLALDSSEGSVEGAWQLIDVLMGPYGDHRLTLYVPNLCTGPGALLAIAADTILMDNAARIGPVSASMNPDLVTMKNALSGLKVLTSQLPNPDLIAGVTAQVSLAGIGQHDREMELARQYAANLTWPGNSRLVDCMLESPYGPVELLNAAALKSHTSVDMPDEDLINFCSYIKADARDSGLPQPHAMLLSTGNRAAKRRRRAA